MSADVDRDSPEFFAAYQQVVYDYYIEQCSEVLELPKKDLKRVQMVGALMWVIYGVAMQAMPVVAANVLVIAAAAWTAKRARRVAPAATLDAQRSA